MSPPILQYEPKPPVRSWWPSSFAVLAALLFAIGSGFVAVQCVLLFGPGCNEIRYAWPAIIVYGLGAIAGFIGVVSRGEQRKVLACVCIAANICLAGVIGFIYWFLSAFAEACTIGPG